MRILLTCLIAFMIGHQQSTAQSSTISFSSELNNLYNISTLPSYRSNTVSAQVSTYDPTGGNNDGFAGTYSFIRRNPDSSLVLLDLEGPGVINRIWTPTPTNDTIDFYIDDTIKPKFSICFRDLFSGTVFPFVSPLCGHELGGNFCYIPIPFQQRCIIVTRGKNIQFHQLQYRLFNAGTRVQPFSLTLSDQDKQTLKNIGALWNKAEKTSSDFNIDHDPEKTSNTAFDLKPGETRSILNLQQGGRITGIELSPSTAFEGLSKDIDIRFYWDDEIYPAIDCPVADLFGYAFGKRSMQSLLVGSSNNKNYCYIPMPFDKKARIELYYNKGSGTSSIAIRASISYATRKRNVLNEGKFYAVRNGARPPEGKPFNFINVSGRGHFIGTVLQAQGLKAGMTYFFEGDDSTVIDGRMRLHGTGSEDYFNGGWYALLDCWDSKMSLPLHGSLEYSLPFCRTGGYRFYLSDKLSFEENFQHSMEHGPTDNKFPVEYTSVSFYYAATPPKSNGLATINNRKIFIPDTLTLFPQLLEYSVDESITMKPDGLYPTGGSNFSYHVNNGTRLRMSLKELLPGRYELFADYGASEQGCEFSVWQRQAQVSDWKTSFAEKKERRDKEFLGEIKVDDIVNTITLRFKTREGKNEFYLNKFLLIKKP